MVTVTVTVTVITLRRGIKVQENIRATHDKVANDKSAVNPHSSSSSSSSSSSPPSSSSSSMRYINAREPERPRGRKLKKATGGAYLVVCDFGSPPGLSLKRAVCREAYDGLFPAIPIVILGDAAPALPELWQSRMEE
jgi:hypothetical protein